MWLIPMMFSSDDGSNDYAVNPYFNNNGYGSMILVKNMGSTFVYLVLLIILHPLSILLKTLGKKYRL